MRISDGSSDVCSSDLLSMEGPSVERELALVKVAGAGEKRVESLRIADIFRARVVDSSHDHFVFEMTGKSEKLAVFIDLMPPPGLVDVSRPEIGRASWRESVGQSVWVSVVAES